MASFNSSLNNLKIASPCPADWNGMYGDERVRFCGECKLNVYNLSGMTKIEAENLLRNTEGRLCVRYFKRADGTVITKDCPVGWRALKKRVSNLAAAVFTLLIGFLGMFAFTVAAGKGEGKLIGRMLPVLTTPTPEPLMGDVAMSPTPKPTPKQTPKVSPSPGVKMGIMIKPNAEKNSEL